VDNIIVLEPQEALKPYIACYYIMQSYDSGYRSTHYSFPSTYTSLTIYKDSLFGFGENYFLAKESPMGRGGANIQIKKQAPLLVDVVGKVDRVTILFKDFGLNQFVRTPLSEIMDHKNSLYPHWNRDPQFRIFQKKLFEQEDLTGRVALLEEFLLSKYVPRDYTTLRKSITLLCDFEHNYKMNVIADSLGLSLRSFNRLFKQAIGVSPVEYRQIAQFRYSLKQKFIQDQFSNLTEIGYSSHFYDQSYFNKIYKKLTGNTPKAFFQTVDRLGDDKLIFKFVKGH
jgi:AraC-like DNA-binding protein